VRGSDERSMRYMSVVEVRLALSQTLVNSA
jgi:hypothetical protein